MKRRDERMGMSKNTKLILLVFFAIVIFTLFFNAFIVTKPPEGLNSNNTINENNVMIEVAQKENNEQYKYELLSKVEKLEEKLKLITKEIELNLIEKDEIDSAFKNCHSLLQTIIIEKNKLETENKDLQENLDNMKNAVINQNINDNNENNYESNQQLINKEENIEVENENNEEISKDKYLKREGGLEGTAVLVLCYNRPDYLQRTLRNILQYAPQNGEFPIIVSQDGGNAAVWEMIQSKEFYDKVVGIQFLQRGTKKDAYQYISGHYQFALSTVFDKLGFQSVIILEDDMEIAPDFFEYFRAMRKLLKEDKSLYIASAWNDNGMSNRVRNATLIRRSDFFGGLGWMMNKELWDEFRDKWPLGYWDDWMREPEQRLGRHCLHPEISRTYTFGEIGSSGGQFWKTHLQHIKLNDVVVPFTTLDFSYLQEEEWFNFIRGKLQNAVETTDKGSKSITGDVIIPYASIFDFANLAKYFSVMTDEKAMVPRTAYKGVVHFWENDRQVFLVENNYKTTFHLV